MGDIFVIVNNVSINLFKFLLLQNLIMKSYGRLRGWTKIQELTNSFWFQILINQQFNDVICIFLNHGITICKIDWVIRENNTTNFLEHQQLLVHLKDFPVYL